MNVPTRALTLTLLALLLVLAGCDEQSDGAADIEQSEPAAAEPDHEAHADHDHDDHAAHANDEPLPESLATIDLAGLQQLIDDTAESDRILVIDFWATWCVPCVQMFPKLHEGYEQFGEQVHPVSVTIDSPGEYEQKAIKFLAEQHALDNAYILGDPAEQERVVDALGDQWDVVSVPAILIYDREGQLADEFLQGGTEDEILARIDELVNHPVQDADERVASDAAK